jgi:hypothetical protein
MTEKKIYTTNVSDVGYVEFEHFPKKVEQISLENKIEMLQEQIRQDHQNIKNSKELKNVQAELNKFKTSQRFKLTAKKYYCTFYRSDIDPPERGLRGKTESKRNEKKQRIVMMRIPVNLNDASTVHKLQGVTKKSLIIHNWTNTHGWIYIVLSRVRTRNGLFLNKPLVYKPELFILPPDLISFGSPMAKKIPEIARC